MALGTHKYFLSADEACKEEFLDCNVQPKNITTSGFLTLTCDTEPAADLTVNLIRLELSGNGPFSKQGGEAHGDRSESNLCPSGQG